VLEDRGTPTAQDEGSTQSGEVSFALSARTRLANVGVGFAGSCVEDWLSRAVARNPSDLRRHVQRIIHLCERRAPEVANALADLFMVLGTKGYPLRLRLLQRVAPLLSATSLDWFRDRLADGRAAHVGLPEDCVSLLGSGATGTTRLVERCDSPAAAAHSKASSDLLESISEYILQGQFAAACEMLENEIRAAPGDLALQRELARILAHRNDPEARLALIARLRAQDIELIAELQV